MNSKTFAGLFFAASATLAQVPAPPQPVPNGPAPVMQESLSVSYDGSVASGQVSATPVALSLRDAIQRGLRYNLQDFDEPRHCR